MKVRMDINCDTGEGFGVYRMGNDERVLDWVTSANIACGYHAGDPSTMRRTVTACLARGVSIGAHPGLPDLSGFGRREMMLSPDETYEIVLYQIGALHAIAHAEGGNLKHVKPHGALYHMAETVPGIADAIVKAVAAFDETLAIYGMANGTLVNCAARLGLKAMHEAFADRTYQSANKLSPRSSAVSVITEPRAAADQAVMIAGQSCVLTLGGDLAPLRADTLCIHGDNLQAAQIAQAVHRALLVAN